MARGDKRREQLLAEIQDPAVKKHTRAQLAMEDDLEAEGLLNGSLPLASSAPLTGGSLLDETLSRRTYVFQWFERGEDAACAALVVHTAGTERALALFEQNAACGALVHNEHVSPRCEVLALDADDCQTCFGAGKLSVRGKQSESCKVCSGSGKERRLFR